LLQPQGPYHTKVGLIIKICYTAVCKIVDAFFDSKSDTAFTLFCFNNIMSSFLAGILSKKESNQFTLSHNNTLTFSIET